MRRRFSPEFKVGALKLVTDRGFALAQAAGVPDVAAERLPSLPFGEFSDCNRCLGSVSILQGHPLRARPLCNLKI